MSNLGLYQSMTTWAKKVGGPVQLFAAVAVGGYIVIRFGEASVKKVVKTIKNHTAVKRQSVDFLYTVHSAGESNEGLCFNVGDTYRLLEIDGDSALIEKIGDSNNPYFVSANLLRSISDFN